MFIVMTPMTTINFGLFIEWSRLSNILRRPVRRSKPAILLRAGRATAKRTTGGHGLAQILRAELRS